MVTGLGEDVASQMERTAVVTHGQFNIPEFAAAIHFITYK